MKILQNIKNGKVKFQQKHEDIHAGSIDEDLDHINGVSISAVSAGLYKSLSRTHQG